MTHDEKKAVTKALGGKRALNRVLKAQELTDEQYETLYPIYQEDMPYGTQKARTGDPYNFIMDRLNRIANKEQT